MKVGKYMTVTMTMEEYMNLQQNYTNNWDYEYEFAELKKENEELKEANKKLQAELFDCRPKFDLTFYSKEFAFSWQNICFNVQYAGYSLTRTRYKQ